MGPRRLAAKARGRRTLGRPPRVHRAERGIAGSTQDRTATPTATGESGLHLDPKWLHAPLSPCLFWGDRFGSMISHRTIRLSILAVAALTIQVDHAPGETSRHKRTEKTEATADGHNRRAAHAETSPAKSHSRRAEKSHLAGPGHHQEAAPHLHPVNSVAPISVATAATPSASSFPAGMPGLSPGELGSVKEALELARKAKPDEASGIERSLPDPAARKLVEWAILRSDENNVDFDRYAAFIQANPTWPNIGMFRRRAEAALWRERRTPATVRSFFATSKPLSALGDFAVARVLLSQGDRTEAERLVREAWRTEAFSADIEEQVLESFPDMLTRVDFKARMDRRLYAEDVQAAFRMAHRLGASEMAIAKARAAVSAKAANAQALLDAVPVEARNDPGYMFSRIQWLRRNERIPEATQLLLAAPNDLAHVHDPDEWWVERRLVARKLLDDGDVTTAYQITRDATPPFKENYRAEHQFTAGWIALRFLDSPTTAMAHFARIAIGITNPITLARANYWQGRAAEAAGQIREARAHYEAAARYPTAYYGQIARAKLGLKDIGLRPLPDLTPPQQASLMAVDLVRATEILYAINEHDLVIPFVTDLADRPTDPEVLRMIAEITQRHQDARALMLLGKTALARGGRFDQYAFPTIGVPNYTSIGPEVDRAVIYSIVRQESTFDQRTVSTAHALGLLQVTPEAGRYVAKKYGVGYDEKRLLSDPVYNTQMGAGELGGLLQDYRGSYILTFAGYNAGEGRVHEWIGRFGDPRDPGVDPIDWVERIPFSETRNYVQRVMENLQVYRVRFGQGTQLRIEADLRRGAT